MISQSLSESCNWLVGWGKGKGRKGGDGKGRSDYGNYGVRPSIDKNWARERVENARTATSKGTPRRDGGGQSDSRVPGGHTILLVQYSDKSSGKTYSEHDTVSRAMDDICQMYEQVIKMDGGRAQAKYTVEDLWHFVERLEDIACMVFDAKVGEYRPHDREWIKNQVLRHLKGQLS